MRFDFQDRRDRLRETMASMGVDSVVLSVGADMPYLTGYEAMPSERLTALVITKSDCVLFVPELEAPGVGVTDLEVRPWAETVDPVALVGRLLGPGSRIAVGDQMWSVFLTRLLDHVPGVTWSAASEVMRPLRIVKDDAEVDLLRRAAQGVDRVMARIPGEVGFAGRSELDVARQLARLTVEEGHDSAEFTIVASGPNGASPHHHPGEREIEEGDLIVCDFGGRLGGYYSDSTRTFVVGDPSPHAVEVHSVVAAANRAGRELAGPDVTCAEVDAATRRVVSDAGYGELFIHRTGHGIGLEVHEHPYIVKGDQTALAPGMAFSIEPGVYVPGDFGVRIEDIVVCTDAGIVSLNESSRGLVQVS